MKPPFWDLSQSNTGSAVSAATKRFSSSGSQGNKASRSVASGQDCRGCEERVAAAGWARQPGCSMQQCECISMPEQMQGQDRGCISRIAVYVNSSLLLLLTVGAVHLHLGHQREGHACSGTHTCHRVSPQPCQLRCHQAHTCQLPNVAQVPKLCCLKLKSFVLRNISYLFTISSQHLPASTLP